MRKSPISVQIAPNQVRNHRFGTILRCDHSWIFNHSHHWSNHTKWHHSHHINLICVLFPQEVAVYVDHSLGCWVGRKQRANETSRTWRKVNYGAAGFSASHDGNHCAVQKDDRCPVRLKDIENWLRGVLDKFACSSQTCVVYEDSNVDLLTQLFEVFTDVHDVRYFAEVSNNHL